MSISQSGRARNQRKRFIGWAMFYMLVFGAFLVFVYGQGRQIPTYALPDGQITLRTSKTMYAVGDNITYSITNGLNSSITFVNRCPQQPLHVYQWQNGAWSNIQDVSDAANCAEQPARITIAANSTYTDSYAKWPKLFQTAGIYRIVAYTTNYASIPYADFIVASPSQNTSTPTIIYQPIYIPVPSIGGDRGGDN